MAEQTMAERIMETIAAGPSDIPPGGKTVDQLPKADTQITEPEPEQGADDTPSPEAMPAWAERMNGRLDEISARLDRQPGDAPKPESEPSYDDVLDPLVESLGLDAEKGQKVKAAFQGFAKAVRPKPEPNTDQATIRHMAVNGAREALVKDYPKLADPQALARVQARMDSLWRRAPGEYKTQAGATDYHALMRDAAFFEFRDDIARGAAAARTQDGKRRDQGVMSAPKPGKAGVKSPDERMWDRFNDIADRAERGELKVGV